MAYVKPVRPVMTVAPDRIAEFEKQKPDSELLKEQKRIVELFRKNLVKLIEE